MQAARVAGMTALCALFTMSAGVARPGPALPADVSRLQVRVGFAQPGGGYRITSIPLETYVARVLAGEAARDSRPAALEALAIAVRTFALANLNRHRADGFDLCDQTHCQVVRVATDSTGRAATATAGRVLIRNGAPASIYYTASCGGRTEIPSAVWPGAEDPPYLPSQPDDACGGGPVWTAELKATDLLRALQAAGFRGGRVRNVTIAGRDVSGRVARLRLDGLTPTTISGQDLRVAVGRVLGWQQIKSTAFDLMRRGELYRFSGHGYGHGVGMCVIGSARLAAGGQNADAILTRYFPGLDIATLGPRMTAAPPAPAIGAPAAKRVMPEPPARAAAAAAGGPEVLVALPDEDSGEQQAIAAAAAAARDDLSRMLALAPPPRVTIRVHPTTDSYQQATGRAWFTSGALVNGDLHLLPLATLRDRGVLDRTLRREIAHQLLDGPLANRPVWVREGAALYFADPGAVATRPSAREPRVSCPADAELQRPVSIGALANAWGRARACFARQIGEGRTWREVR